MKKNIYKKKKVATSNISCVCGLGSQREAREHISASLAQDHMSSPVDPQKLYIFIFMKFSIKLVKSKIQRCRYSKYSQI